MPRQDGKPTIAEILGFPSQEAMEAHREGEEARLRYRRAGFFPSPKWPAGTPERDAWEQGWEEAAEVDIPPWPPGEDCPGCPGHRDGIEGHPEGGHKMSCSVTKGRLTLPVRRGEDGKLYSEYEDPLAGPAIDLHRDIPLRVTSHKPGTPGWEPPPPRPFGEAAGVEPPYQETYQRRVKPLEEMPHWPDSELPKEPEEPE